MEGILQFKAQEANDLTQLVSELREAKESTEDENSWQKKQLEALTAERDRLMEQNSSLREAADLMKRDYESQTAKLKDGYETMLSNQVRINQQEKEQAGHIKGEAQLTVEAKSVELKDL